MNGLKEEKVDRKIAETDIPDVDKRKNAYLIMAQTLPYRYIRDDRTR